ncbi:MAG: hypothetical protein KAS95_04525 [Candidatus Heimdallarchaeota archaeon]|nr:hypothetical protein [Candidatus Heimdallarchaeota archaeon]
MMMNKRIVIFSLLTAVIVTGVGLGLYFGLKPPQQEEIVLTITNENDIITFTMDDITKHSENILSSGGYKKTTGTIVGPDDYKGVPVIELLESLGGLNESQEITAISSDGYKMTYSSSMVNGLVTAYDNVTGVELGVQSFEMVLIYEEIGETILDGGPLRIGFLSDDGYVSDGQLWAKEVIKMEMNISSSSWSVDLYGLTNSSIDRPIFEASMYCGTYPHRQTYEIVDGDRTHIYEGVGLWIIISIIDGGEPVDDPHYIFNDDLIGQGYKVVLKNKDGLNVTLNFDDIARNNSYILAAKRDSAFLKETVGPLKLVGSEVNSLQMIEGIIEIWLIK